MLFSFPGTSAPAGFKNALVQIVDGKTDALIVNAGVTMNGVKLVYNPDPHRQEFEGVLTVAPGAAVDLHADVGGDGYEASATQFLSPPTISAPQAGVRWDPQQQNILSWSGGAPTAGARYMIAILDANDPNGGQAAFEFFDTFVTSLAIPANSLTAGAKLVLVGIATAAHVRGADARSFLLVALVDVVPISVGALSNIAVTPANASIPKGTTQQYAATGNYTDGSTTDLTAQVTWGTSDFYLASITRAGLARGEGVGTATITATLGILPGSVAGSTKLTINPPVFVSVASVGPANAAFPAGVNQQFIAEAQLSDGSPQDITSTAAWSSSTGAATVSQSGLVTSVATGTTTITAALNGQSASTTLTVTDWTARTSGTTNNLWAAASSGGQFVAVGDHGTILTSPDGSSWTARTSHTTDPLHGAAWSGTQFVAVGGDVNALTAIIVTSPDGVTWTPQTAGIAVPLMGVTWSGTQFVAVGGVPHGYLNPTAAIVTSPDGVTWTARAAGGNSLLGVVWSGTQFVAVGETILTSPDGAAWTPTGTHLFSELASVAWSGTQFMATGYGAVFTSPDGATWTSRVSAYFPFVPGVVWSGTAFVAVGVWGAILYSPDGITWTSHGWGLGQLAGPYFYGVTRSPTTLLAIGSGGSVFTSSL